MTLGVETWKDLKRQVERLAKRYGYKDLDNVPISFFFMDGCEPPVNYVTFLLDTDFGGEQTRLVLSRIPCEEYIN